MALKKLKKGLEDAQAFQDKSSGKDTLREVLADMAKAGPILTETVPGIIATGQLNAMIFPFAVRLVSLTIVVFDTGDSGKTDVDVNTAAGTHTLASIDNSEAGGTVKTSLPGEGTGATAPAEIPANTEISVSVTAAPGASSGASLTATALFSPIDIE